MATTEFSHTHPAAGDNTNALLAKILQRLNLNASIAGDSSAESFPIRFAEPAVDAFSRLRISDPFTLSDSKQLLDYTGHNWDDVAASGAGTSTLHVPRRASTLLGVSSNTAGKRVRQTYRRFNYQPGKSQLYVGTFRCGGTEAGITRRIGLFDNNDGIFFQLQGSTKAFVVRSSVTNTPEDDVIPQSTWNVDKMDGTGPSGVTLDITKAQIFWFDFEWLGVGTVRFGFYVNGIPVVCHKDHHSNVIDSVYMSNPNLPMRYEIDNDGTGVGSVLESICCTVNSEGGQEEVGLMFNASRNATSITTANDANLYPIVGIRLKSGAASSMVLPLLCSVVCTSTSAFEWSLIRNPTIAGSAPTWTSVSPAVEAALTPANTNLLTNGTIICSGYCIQQNEASMSVRVPREWALGVSYAGVSDTLFLAVRKLSGQAETFYGSMSFGERT